MLVALFASCAVAVAVAVPAQASVAGAVTGTLDALGAAGTQQLAAVTQGTPPVPLPSPSAPAPAVAVAQDSTQTVDTVPQAAASTAEAVRSSASRVAERPPAKPPAEGNERGGPDLAGARLPTSPSHAAVTIAKRAGPLPSSITLAPAHPRHTVPARALRARIGPAAHMLLRPSAKRIAGVLARTAPVARDLGSAGTAPTLAGTLSAAVADLSGVARDALTAVPVPNLAALPQIATPPTLPEQPSAGERTAMRPAPLGDTETPLAPAPTLAPDAGAPAPGVAALALTVRTAPAPPAPGGASSRQASSTATHSERAGANRTGGMATPAGDYIPAGIAARASRLTAGTAQSPAPPGGSSPASGAAATGGISGSTLFALLGLLLLAGASAMRLIWLAAGSRRPAQFVLIPERPG